MAETFDLIVKNGECVTPAGRQSFDLGIRDGRIIGMGDLSEDKAAETFDAKGLTVLPGVIDSQVHFREPGLEHKEDLESGTRAAILGGVTCVFEMPNTNPSTTTIEAFNDKLRRAEGRTWTDHAFFIGASPDNVENLGFLEKQPGCAGVKIFMGSSTGSLLVDDEEALKLALENGHRRVAVHCEDEERLKERRSLIEGINDPAMHPVWRDEKTALRATHKLIRYARTTGRRVHVSHVTTAEEMKFLSLHKEIATVEVTPQHLTLAAPSCYMELGSRAQMNPPVRVERHREALWRGVATGIVDVVGSDHAPHTLEEKAKPYPNSPSGMPGVQTLLPVLLGHLSTGRLSLERLVDLTSAGPARIYGIAGKGRIALGYDGDLTLVDLEATRRISDSDMATKSGWTPFHDMEVKGWPVATIVRGQIVMRDGQTVGDPIGQPVRFQETLAGAQARL